MGLTERVYWRALKDRCGTNMNFSTANDKFLVAIKEIVQFVKVKLIKVPHKKRRKKIIQFFRRSINDVNQAVLGTTAI